MNIKCQKCETTYSIDASKIPAAGAAATCKKCGNKFRFTPPATLKTSPAATPPPLPETAAQSLPDPPVPVPISVEERENQLCLKPLSGLTKTLRVLLILYIVVLVIAVMAGIYEYHTYENLPMGTDINEVLLPSDAVTAAVGLVQLALLIFLGITFLRWIYRANKNLSAVSGQPMDFTPGWAVGWYFIPIANLFKPFQAMKEIWQVSHKNQDDSGTILGIWWLLWLLSNILGDQAFDSIMGAESIAEHTMTTAIYLVSDGLDVFLSIVALMLVSRIGAAFSNNYRELKSTNREEPVAPRPVQRERPKVNDLQSCLL